MTIDRLGRINQIDQYSNTTRKKRADRSVPKDQVDVSAEAKSKGEIFAAAETAKAAPEVRMDRVEEVRAKLKDPDYINDTVVNAVADQIMNVFGLD